jgi:signal transduction histidine kinase
MNPITSFFQQNITLVYFAYGLAFFSMGLAVWLESGRTSELRLARAMGPLAAFGILHGIHEWMEMFQLLGEVVPGAPAVGQTLAVDAFRVGLLTLSFFLLIIFGVRLIHLSGKGRGNERTFVLLSAGLLIIIWLVSVVSTQRFYNLCLADCLVSIDVLTRYILAIPGSLLAAWAMFLEQRAFQERGMRVFSRDLQLAAITLILYGVIGQIFVPESLLFPSNVINTQLFLTLFGVPVQFFRALMAAAMAFFVIRALRGFEVERQQRLSLANEERLQAQQEALATQRQAREDTEALNRELQRVVQDLSLLFELSRQMVTTLDRDELLEKTLSQILTAVPHIHAGMILVREAEGEPLRPMLRFGCAPEGGTATDVVCDRMRRVGEEVVQAEAPALCCNGEIHILTHAVSIRPQDSDTSFIADAEGRILGVPLIIQEEVCGSLVLGVSIESVAFTTRDLALLNTIAGQLSMALENARLYREVQERESLRGELYQRIVSAQERERQRIARELHDGTGQVLTGLGLGLMAAAESVRGDPDRAARQLLELKDLNAQALRELRDLIGNLRPSILDDMGLVPALKSQVGEFTERTGIEAGFRVTGHRQRLPDQTETVIFRIAQEALTNVAKHAQAEHAFVHVVFEEEQVQLVVTDNGRGFDPVAALRENGDQRRAWGLLGMQERVTLVGGECEIASQPGTGTTVRVVVPLQVAEKDEIDGKIEDSLDAG